MPDPAPVPAIDGPTPLDMTSYAFTSDTLAATRGAPAPFVTTADRPPLLLAAGLDGLTEVDAPEAPETTDATEVGPDGAEDVAADELPEVDALAVEAATLAGATELARWSRGSTFSELAADVRELADKGPAALARHRSLLAARGFSA